MAPRAKNPTKRTKKLSAPAYAEEVQDWYAACRKMNLVPAITLRELANAFIDHVDQCGSITKPIKLAPPPAEKKR